MRKNSVMGVPAACFWAVVAACLLGILVGSFFDFEISEALANKTEAGDLFATYCLIVPHFFYAAAGGCIYTGLAKKRKPLARTLLAVVVFYAVYQSESRYGSRIRGLFGYIPGESAAILYLPTWLFWVAVYALVAFVVIRLLDDSDPDRVLAVGVAILAAGIISGSVNSWLKMVGARPRYKYLLKQDDPRAEFRNWWQMVPCLSGSDNFKSWPSGHMTSFGILFTLPMLTDVMKNRSRKRNMIAFCLVCVLTLICGYNRIHMTNHFLSDVCFGCLNTYLIFSGVSTAFLGNSTKTP